MAQLLHRLGRFAFRRRRHVLVGWLLAVGITLGGSMLWSGTPANGLDVPGTEAQQAIDTLQREFPQADAGGASAQVVIAAGAGTTLAQAPNPAAVAGLISSLGAAPQVEAVTALDERSTSPDGRFGIIEVRYAV